MQLAGKKILIGISAGIAAYKVAELVRLLVKEGALVKVMMTRGATQLITPLTLHALSKNPVYSGDQFASENSAMLHIDLAKWADLILIAPATADVLAKLAHGFCDDLLTTTCLAAENPIALAPAMNCVMWHKSITQTNLQLLQQNHYLIWGPESGDQACGDFGMGRMLDVLYLLEHIQNFFRKKILIDKKIVITAGPTREPLDPVRYLSNFSSGKMGFALAEAAYRLGATVVLITGPTSLIQHSGIKRINVTTAAEMHTAVLTEIKGCDWFIAAAAVADYRVATVAAQKIRKTQQSSLQLNLTSNVDIVSEIAARPKRPKIIGFSLATQNGVAEAKQKIQRKKLDLIVANEVGENSGFESDYNKVVVLNHQGKKIAEYAGRKELIAFELLNCFAAED